MIYLQILRFSFLRFFAYPFEILAEIAKTTVIMLFLIFFWSVVSKDLHGSFDFKSIVSYFLIATGVKEVVMADYGAFGAHLGDLIKTGGLNNVFLRPISALPSIYFTALGRNGVVILVAVVNILVGLYINPPTSVLAVVLFFAFLINAIIVSLAFNLLSGLLYIHTPDASGFVNVINHAIQIFSGAMIPIYLFPGILGDIVKLTPFPVMIFGPTNALRLNNINSEVLLAFAVGIFWSVSLNILIYWFWRQSIKKYEAIGI